MKKNILTCLVLLGLLWPLFSCAQNVFAPVGAEWYYAGVAGYWYPTYSYLRLNVTGDTTIDDVPCRRIDQVGVSLGNTSHYDPLFVYDTPDTVFIYNRFFHRFTPLYVFNVSEGDTVCLPFLYDIYNNEPLGINPYTGDTSFCFIIDSIKMMPYDTAMLKTFYTHGLFESWSDMTPKYNWDYYPTFDQRGGGYAERIGGIRAGILPRRLESWIEKATYANTTFYDVRCYHDSSLAIKMVPGPCDTMYSLSIGDVPDLSGRIRVFPNPASDRVQLEHDLAAPAAVRVQLTDMSGKELAVFGFGKNQRQISFDTRHLPAGMYFLKITSEQGAAYKKLIVQH